MNTTVELTWTPRPGTYQRFIEDQLQENNPEIEALESSMRAGLESLSSTDLRQLWNSFLRRLRGLRYDSVILKDEPVWVSIMDLHTPPGSGKSCRY